MYLKNKSLTVDMSSLNIDVTKRLIVFNEYMKSNNLNLGSINFGTNSKNLDEKVQKILFF